MIHIYIFINSNLQLHEYNKCTTTQLDSQDQGYKAPSWEGKNFEPKKTVPPGSTRKKITVDS